MLVNQKAAVDRNLEILTDDLEGNAVALFGYLENKGTISHSERQLVDTKVTSTDRLRKVLRILKAKDSGWTVLLSFLRENNQKSLADKLQSDADGVTEECPAKKSKRSALDRFSPRVAKHYKQRYATVTTMCGSTKHVKDIWVPLQLDGRREDHLTNDLVDHVELLHRLKSSEQADVALIRADPGMGKTTLVKQIAYEWAVSRDSSTVHPFSLVLAVPVRLAPTSDRFDHLAIDYFLSTLDREDIDRTELILDIKQLNSQFLVILDGVDEYCCYEETPLKDIFGPPFKHSASRSNKPLSDTTAFKLIITSRPYACVRINDDFMYLRFVIQPPHTNRTCHFVQNYCKSPRGVAVATNYLQTKLVVQFPLILEIICSEADSAPKSLSNMTNLYENFINCMLWRERRQEKLEELVDMGRWKESIVIQTTAQLAYLGCTTDTWVFDSKSLEKCSVTNDSFICGFLLHRFDDSRGILMAEFPHPLIQQFFAASHCYRLMLLGDRDESCKVCKLVFTNGDSHLGRFLFGICSKERQLGQMSNWLLPSLSSPEFDPTDADTVTSLDDTLMDCSANETRAISQLIAEVCCSALHRSR